MELMTLGNLRSLMSDQSDKMDQEQLAYMYVTLISVTINYILIFYRTKDIIAGIQYLHSKNIVHRDISLRKLLVIITINYNTFIGNILVSESTGSRKFTVKISDFGM